ncbi:hypothetical protein Ptr902_10286 [Pyrenophora tritici-repentis]|uniref:Uncharacterized protein n=1 Tax=Pyrenophora tritici-repentis TaxID=45151 RepID=A0A5M9KWM7_9PLEO|nr:hypothetical protein PtrV1_10902 [Pyrenophora tritici-repentis]KAF7443917.1 hypothetical protein A1F99_119910 [Pyrenophora tritici-repentis]KAF7566362.1 hypothetical protein PtrM4_146820 [Pyrenophora tritici-repentis]KAI0586298.1 hypothetical protein Alg215_02073 [Pyrenophora tritici-repentis]KAI2478091.1 hypothetical protein Ptr902_10286 [Pyrenophora tritici-repentis]
MTCKRAAWLPACAEAVPAAAGRNTLTTVTGYMIPAPT